MTVTQHALQFENARFATNIVSAEAERYRLYATGLGVLYEGDCLEILPFIQDETVDTIFADPPFNLAKNYGSKITDELPDDKYINWCKEWLWECTRLLKPGGSLFVYNLPKWNLILGNYLLEMGLLLRHWIAINIK
ncbi:MAG: site-specific DNA-methyltransferase, partial [Proteobacteria bacterium]|nr:site-specific DNA-methyltransferase [Pseudomonadota bacterium]